MIKYVETFNKDPKHKKKLTYDEEEFNFELARKLFKEPDVVDVEKTELLWGKPDYEGLKKFLVEEKNFSETRIDNAMKRIENAKSKASQTRMENFFQLKPMQTSVKIGKKKDEEKFTAKKKGRSAKK